MSSPKGQGRQRSVKLLLGAFARRLSCGLELSSKHESSRPECDCCKPGRLTLKPSACNTCSATVATGRAADDGCRPLAMRPAQQILHGRCPPAVADGANHMYALNSPGNGHDATGNLQAPAVATATQQRSNTARPAVFPAAAAARSSTQQHAAAARAAVFPAAGASILLDVDAAATACTCAAATSPLAADRSLLQPYSATTSNNNPKLPAPCAAPPHDAITATGISAATQLAAPAPAGCRSPASVAVGGIPGVAKPILRQASSFKLSRFGSTDMRTRLQHSTSCDDDLLAHGAIAGTACGRVSRSRSINAAVSTSQAPATAAGLGSGCKQPETDARPADEPAQSAYAAAGVYHDPLPISLGAQEHVQQQQQQQFGNKYQAPSRPVEICEATRLFHAADLLPPASASAGGKAEQPCVTKAAAAPPSRPQRHVACVTATSSSRMHASAATDGPGMSTCFLMSRCTSSGGLDGLVPGRAAPLEPRNLRSFTMPSTGQVCSTAAEVLAAQAEPLDPLTMGAHLHLSRKLGEGAHGVVYQGLWLGCPAAVKLVTASEPDALSSALTEVLLCKTLAHPNVVQTYACSLWQVTHESLAACDALLALARIGAATGGPADPAAVQDRGRSLVSTQDRTSGRSLPSLETPSAATTPVAAGIQQPSSSSLARRRVCASSAFSLLESIEDVAEASDEERQQQRGMQQPSQQQRHQQQQEMPRTPLSPQCYGAATATHRGSGGALVPQPQDSVPRERLSFAGCSIEVDSFVRMRSLQALPSVAPLGARRDQGRTSSFHEGVVAPRTQLQSMPAAVAHATQMLHHSTSEQDAPPLEGSQAAGSTLVGRVRRRTSLAVAAPGAGAPSLEGPPPNNSACWGGITLPVQTPALLLQSAPALLPLHLTFTGTDTSRLLHTDAGSMGGLGSPAAGQSQLCWTFDRGPCAELAASGNITVPDSGAVSIAQAVRTLCGHHHHHQRQVLVQIVMEECDRGSLQQLLSRTSRLCQQQQQQGPQHHLGGAWPTLPEAPPVYAPFLNGGRWSASQALHALVLTAKEVALGMAFLHMQGVVHGDIKPGNVLLRSSRADLRGWTAKISDFGLSKVRHANQAAAAQAARKRDADNAEMTVLLLPEEGFSPSCRRAGCSSTMQGTMAYLAPEAMDGETDKPGDVYSYGVLLWQLVTGRRPYEGMNTPQVCAAMMGSDCPLDWPAAAHPTLVQLGRACTDFQPAHRPTFAQVVRALQAFEPVTAAAAATATPPPPLQQRQQQQR